MTGKILFKQRGGMLIEALFVAILFGFGILFLRHTEASRQKNTTAMQAATAMFGAVDAANRMVNFNLFDLEQISMNAYALGVDFNTCAKTYDCADLYGNLNPLAGISSKYPLTGQAAYASFSMNDADLSAELSPGLSWPNGAPQIGGMISPQWAQNNSTNAPVPNGENCQSCAAPMGFLQAVYYTPQAGSLPLADYDAYWSYFNGLWKMDSIFANHSGYLYAATSATNPAPATDPSTAVVALNGLAGHYFTPLSKKDAAGGNYVLGMPSIPVIAALKSAHAAMPPNQNAQGLPLGQFLPAFLTMRPTEDGIILGNDTTGSTTSCWDGSTGTVLTTYQYVTQAGAAAGSCPSGQNQAGVSCKMINYTNTCPPQVAVQPPPTGASGAAGNFTININTGAGNATITNCHLSGNPPTGTCQVTMHSVTPTSSNTTTYTVNVCQGPCTFTKSVNGDSSALGMTTDTSGNLVLTTFVQGISNYIDTGVSTSGVQQSTPSQSYVSGCLPGSSSCQTFGTAMSNGQPVVNGQASNLSLNTYDPTTNSYSVQHVTFDTATHKLVKGSTCLPKPGVPGC